MRDNDCEFRFCYIVLTALIYKAVGIISDLRIAPHFGDSDKIVYGSLKAI